MGLGDLRSTRDRSIIRVLEMFPLKRSERRLRNLYRCVAHGCSPEMRHTLRRRVATYGIPARLRCGCAVRGNNRDRGLRPGALDMGSAGLLQQSRMCRDAAAPIELVIVEEECPRASEAERN